MKKNKIENLDSVNAFVGAKIRQRRNLLGMSQADLAQASGISSQQIIHKYEKGVNRISAGSLVAISDALKVPVSFFFEGILGVMGGRSGQPGFAEEAQPPLLEDDPTAQKRAAELLRAYYNIQDPKLRKQLLEMAKAMAEAQSDS